MLLRGLMMNKKTTYFFYAVIFSIILSGKAVAQSNAEDEVLKTVKNLVSVVLTDLKANKTTYQNNQSMLNRMIDEKVLPYFDTEAMARLVLAKYWKLASKQQKDVFINEFKELIMRSYSLILLSYTDAKVKYGKPRKIKRNRTKIDATVINSNGKKVELTFSMGYRNNHWKAYDVSLSGLSIIISYRGSIGEGIAKKGLDGVINQITALNAKGGIINEEINKSK